MVLFDVLPGTLVMMKSRVRSMDVSPAVGVAVVDLVATDRTGRVSVGSPQATSDHSMELNATPLRLPARY
jgi:hypothetical protein